MFLVEPESGPRCHYSSARALGAAIRRGELTPQARIFHQTSNRWLPITVHPEYRRAESDWEQGSGRRLMGRRWTYLPKQPLEDDSLMAASPPPANSAPPPLLVPGELETSWLGSAFRHLLQLARPGI